MTTRSVKEIVDLYITQVKKEGTKHRENERYKFESYLKFRDNFSLNAPDLVNMLENSLPRNNLDSGGHYFAGKMLRVLADFDSEGTRHALNILFDKTLDIHDRIYGYLNQIKNLMARRDSELGKSDMGPDDARFISLLLSFSEPAKFMNYKYNEFRQTYIAAGHDSADLKLDIVERILKVRNFGYSLLNELKSRPEFPQLKEELLGDIDTKIDENNLWLAQDIYWVVASLLKPPLQQSLDIKKILGNFIQHVDAGNLSRKGFSGLKYNDLTSAAWVNVASKNGDNQLNVPYILFGYRDREEKRLKGDVWPNTRFGFLYDRINHILYLVHGWNDGTDVPIGEGRTPNNAWSEFFIRKKYDPQNIPDSIKNDFEILANEYIRRYETMDNQEKELDIGLNTILYGPPGTGKTYRTNLYKTDIINNKIDTKLAMRNTYGENATYSINQWLHAALAAFTEVGLHERLTIDEILNTNAVKKFAQTMHSKSPKDTLYRTLGESATNRASGIQKRNPGYLDRIEGKWFLTDLGIKYAQKIKKINTESQVVKNEVKANIEPHRYEFITFHQSYGYEEFIEGIRPEVDPVTNQIKYEVQDGVFKAFCQRAAADPDNKYLFIIDEINRGNISKIFGELITLIEPDKRLGADGSGLEARLPYSKEKFGVPSNVYIIGTMNTADRSIALLDTALRRRFDFIEIAPDISLVSANIEGVNGQLLLKRINEYVSRKIDRDHRIGHAYLMNDRVNSLSKLHRTWYYKILPLLQEYFYDDINELTELLGNFIKNGEIKKLDGDEFKLALQKIYAEETTKNN